MGALSNQWWDNLLSIQFYGIAREVGLGIGVSESHSIGHLSSWKDASHAGAVNQSVTVTFQKDLDSIYSNHRFMAGPNHSPRRTALRT